MNDVDRMPSTTGYAFYTPQGDRVHVWPDAGSGLVVIERHGQPASTAELVPAIGRIPLTDETETLLTTIWTRVLREWRRRRVA
jgi:hypothetical protein